MYEILSHEVSVQDDYLSSLKHTVLTGWPGQMQDMVIQPHWNFHEDINIEDGLLLRGTRNIFPISQRKALPKHLHVGQLSPSKSLHRSKQTAYCPGLYAQIHELVTNYQTGLKFSNNNSKQPACKQLGQEVLLVP